MTEVTPQRWDRGKWDRARWDAQLVLPADTRTIALTGSPAGLRIARAIGTARGTIALTGSATSLRATRRLLAAPGILTLTGYPATFQTTTTRRLIAATGALTLTGHAVLLRPWRAYRLPAAAGAIALTGIDAELLVYAPGHRVLEAEMKAIVLTGMPVTFRLGTRKSRGDPVSWRSLQNRQAFIPV